MVICALLCNLTYIYIHIHQVQHVTARLYASLIAKRSGYDANLQMGTKSS